MAPRRAPSPASPSSAIASAFAAARREWDRSERRLRAPDGATLGGIPRVPAPCAAVAPGAPDAETARCRRAFDEGGPASISGAVGDGRHHFLAMYQPPAPPPGAPEPALRRARNRFGAPFGSSASPPDDDERAGSSAPGPHSEDAPAGAASAAPAPAVVLHPGGAGGVALDTSHAAFDGVFDARTAAVADLALDAWDVQCAATLRLNDGAGDEPGPTRRRSNTRCGFETTARACFCADSLTGEREVALECSKRAAALPPDAPRPRVRLLGVTEALVFDARDPFGGRRRRGGPEEGDQGASFDAADGFDGFGPIPGPAPFPIDRPRSIAIPPPRVEATVEVENGEYFLYKPRGFAPGERRRAGGSTPRILRDGDEKRNRFRVEKKPPSAVFRAKVVRDLVGVRVDSDRDEKATTRVVLEASFRETAAETDAKTPPGKDRPSSAADADGWEEEASARLRDAAHRTARYRLVAALPGGAKTLRSRIRGSFRVGRSVRVAHAVAQTFAWGPGAPRRDPWRIAPESVEVSAEPTEPNVDPRWRLDAVARPSQRSVGVRFRGSVAGVRTASRSDAWSFDWGKQSGKPAEAGAAFRREWAAAAATGEGEEASESRGEASDPKAPFAFARVAVGGAEGATAFVEVRTFDEGGGLEEDAFRRTEEDAFRRR